MAELLKVRTSVLDVAYERSGPANGRPIVLLLAAATGQLGKLLLLVLRQRHRREHARHADLVAQDRQDRRRRAARRGLRLHRRLGAARLHRLQRGLVVEEKYLRVANYATGMNKEIDMIAHSCGCRHARELRREHVRIVQTAGHSAALNVLYPYPEPNAKRKAA